MHPNPAAPLYRRTAVSWFLVAATRIERRVATLAAFTLLAAACSAPPVSGHGPATTPESAAAPKPDGHLGDTLDLVRIGGQQIAVTLRRVVNPATVPHGWGEAGKTYVATTLTITNTGASTIVGNTNSEVMLVGSDNRDYRADIATVTECADFNYGWFLLAAGASTTGCVVFALPPGVRPAKVRYTPSSGISRDVGEWITP